MAKGVINVPSDAPAAIVSKMIKTQKMVEVRLFFVKMPGSPSQVDYVLPSEQRIFLRDTDEITASFARSTFAKVLAWNSRMLTKNRNCAFFPASRSHSRRQRTSVF